MIFKGSDHKPHYIQPVRLNEHGRKSDIRHYRSQATVDFQSKRIARNIVSDRERLRVVKQNKVKAVLKALGVL